jgi:hypothetical protein
MDRQVEDRQTGRNKMVVRLIGVSLTSRAQRVIVSISAYTQGSSFGAFSVSSLLNSMAAKPRVLQNPQNGDHIILSSYIRYHDPSHSRSYHHLCFLRYRSLSLHMGHTHHPARHSTYHDSSILRQNRERGSLSPAYQQTHGFLFGVIDAANL